MSASVPNNLTVCLFQQENAHLPYPLYPISEPISRSRQSIFPSSIVAQVFSATAFDGELCENLLKVKMDYIFSLCFIRSHACIPLQGHT